ncbi:MAG: putative DNA modification/repair radical SAM protein [Granulosicoccus sp.]
MSRIRKDSILPVVPVKLQTKLAILADAAKYDASCSSSGTSLRHSLDGKGVGSTTQSGICHSYAPDGRCISLLKILLTNFCTYDCLYCVNRVSSNVARARFSIDEVVDLTLSFYKRNYIEGLFLSSGIVQSPDYTMEQIVEVARRLRVQHDFRGYIHLKTIPEASPELLSAAGLYADRLSINVELARNASLTQLAPQKDAAGIKRSMAAIRARCEEAGDNSVSGRKPAKFASAGQSTQMIVGADDAVDHELLHCSSTLYSSYKLKRVYYSAFSPIPDASASLPLKATDLMREHRLYQADWLMRFYGFDVQEIVAGGNAGMLDPALDPKLAWALKHREWFPVDINRADREHLLRVPGLGVKGVQKVLLSRRSGSLRLEDLKRISRSVKRMLPFIETRDWSPSKVLDTAMLRSQYVQQQAQMDLFA